MIWQEAASAGVKFLSLPECFSFMGSREGETLSIAEPLDGPILQRYQELARQGTQGLFSALSMQEAYNFYVIKFKLFASLNRASSTCEV